MRVRMLTIWASTHGCFGAGQFVDLPDDIGQQLIKARSAELVDAAGGASTPRAVTGRRPHTAPPAVSTAATSGAPERATADPHNPSGRPDPDGIEDDDDFEDEEEIDEDDEDGEDEEDEEDEEEEEEEEEEPADAMGVVPPEPEPEPKPKPKNKPARQRQRNRNAGKK